MAAVRYIPLRDYLQFRKQKIGNYFFTFRVCIVDAGTVKAKTRPCSKATFAQLPIQYSIGA
jgi:hypothetical protein